MKEIFTIPKKEFSMKYFNGYNILAIYRLNQVKNNAIKKFDHTNGFPLQAIK